MTDSEKLDYLIREVAQLRKAVEKLSPAKPEPFVTKAKALELLDCKGTKLQQLVISGKIQVNANPKKGRRLMYEYKSIQDYIQNPH